MILEMCFNLFVFISVIMNTHEYIIKSRSSKASKQYFIVISLLLSLDRLVAPLLHPLPLYHITKILTILSISYYKSTTALFTYKMYVRPLFIYLDTDVEWIVRWWRIKKNRMGEYYRAATHKKRVVLTYKEPISIKNPEEPPACNTNKKPSDDKKPDNDKLMQETSSDESALTLTECDESSTPNEEPTVENTENIDCTENYPTGKTDTVHKNTDTTDELIDSL